MKKLIVVLVLLVAIPAPVQADSGLTAAVAAAWFSRTIDPALHDFAHQRVLEIAACGGCLTHDRMRAGTAEVLGSNAGYANPVATVIGAWSGSSIHDGILSDTSLGRIGCAEHAVGGTHYFACVLAAGPLPAGGGRTTVATLPDTAMR